jgi:hypothetical protein
MKKVAILTIISLLIAASASAGRYHYRSYHYYGPPNDGGKYLFLIIVGILLLLGLIGLIADAISHAIKESNIGKYKQGAWTMPISPDGKYQHIQEIKSEKMSEYGDSVWIDNKLVRRNGIWAPVFYGVKLRVTKEGKEVLFDKAKNLTSDCLILSNGKAAHFKRPIFGKKKITIEDINMGTPEIELKRFFLFFILFIIIISISISILNKSHQKTTPEKNPTHKTNDREEDSGASDVRELLLDK